MECPLCGTENSEGLTACYICDSSLAKEAKSHSKTVSISERLSIQGEYNTEESAGDRALQFLKKQQNFFRSDEQSIGKQWIELPSTDIGPRRIQWRAVVVVALFILAVAPAFFLRQDFTPSPLSKDAQKIYQIYEKSYKDRSSYWKEKKDQLLLQMRSHGNGGFKHASEMICRDVPYEVFLAYLEEDLKFPIDQAYLLPLGNKSEVLLAKKNSALLFLRLPATAIIELESLGEEGSLGVDLVSFHRGVRELPSELALDAFREELHSLMKMEEFYNGIGEISWNLPQWEMKEGNGIFSFSYHPLKGSLTYLLGEREAFLDRWNGPERSLADEDSLNGGDTNELS
jgi:hypothetical protein